MRRRRRGRLKTAAEEATTRLKTTTNKDGDEDGLRRRHRFRYGYAFRRISISTRGIHAGPCFWWGNISHIAALKKNEGASTLIHSLPLSLRRSAVEASSQDDTLGSSSRAFLTAHDARHKTRVFSTTTSRVSAERDSSLGQPRQKHRRPISAPMPSVLIEGCIVRGHAMRDAQACPRPDGFGRNLRSKTRWFMGFCNSHQVSHFSTFFIDA
ncbi:hypothetical protein L2E82_19987 [Cichorium intybus]|uniref:Uncharacterized protein n=1 Tax=Cichorium intybus TaxID=13427 RepID=A0ACB9DS28_CICIN|nr:hypothetical protein L2E82_19987 [Cichorium intybus]